ncbi:MULTISPECIES: acyltransferase [Acidobacteriaceae]|uniref:acyltransferase family protein n=1 Tax=Acidobacteriaceae TaxID=204434 RepID=UPI00131AF466|nr:MULTISPECIES: acyltransferase [Acidobacteriaceae]MDW5264130.1 acyltransferase [Edaphobacter sp.]
MPSEPANLRRSWTRLDGVDLLRGLAIFFVLMNHVNMRLLGVKVPYTKGLPHQLVFSLVWNGQFGVQIFFVVSGFLITATTLRRWGSLSAISVPDFYRLRFARIAPLLFLLLAVLSGLHLAHLKDFVVPAKTGGLGRALFAALTFHINLLEARRGYLPGGWDILWSLSVEEMFYLFFPLVCRFFSRGKLLVTLLLAFVVLGPFGRTVLAHGNGVWKEYSYLGGMDAIALGCLTALVVSRIRFSRLQLWMLGGSGAILLIFSLCFSIRAYIWGLGRNGLNMTILALGTCMLVALAAQTQWKSPRVLSPLLKLGQRSYEVYLTHMFVVLALFGLFVEAGKPMRGVPALFIAVIVIVGLLGEAIARFFSDPMNRLLRRRFGDGSDKLGSVLEADSRAQHQKGVAV